MLLTRYQKKLGMIPPPGCGCHPALLGVANLGIMAGLPEQKVFEDIRAAIPPGERRLPDREISDAVKKAVYDKDKTTTEWRYVPQKPTPVINDGKSKLKWLLEQAKISEEVDLWESSPIRLDWMPQEDTARFLSIMFAKDDLVFIGERLEPGLIGHNIRRRIEWVEYLKNGGTTAPFIIINPLNGLPAQKKSGEGITYRGDANVLTFRYCMAEFDNLTREEQIRFWAAVNLPVVCLVDTGGKSIHGWIDIQKLVGVNTNDDWQREIEHKLYEQGLVPLGVDPACKNPARLSRLPGHYRAEKNKFQRILWMANKGVKQ